MSNEFFEIAVEYVTETPKAVLVKDGTDDTSKTWIPKSMLEEPAILDQLHGGEMLELSVKTWWLEEEGLI